MLRVGGAVLLVVAVAYALLGHSLAAFLLFIAGAGFVFASRGSEHGSPQEGADGGLDGDTGGDGGDGGD